MNTSPTCTKPAGEEGDRLDTLPAILLEQLEARALPKPLAALCAYMVELLDDDGYLQEEDLRHLTEVGVPDGLLRQALETLHDLEPAGVGATSLGQCLLLQLRRRGQDTPLLEQLPELADRVIIEADGTKGLPLKVPNDREPVIPAFADAVIAVAGLSALGRPLGEVCHRPELAKLRFDLEPDQIVTPELMAMLLSSPLAQRKDVGSRPYAVLLNQADRARPDEIAALATLLLQKGVERVVTAALQRRPGEYEVWKR